MSERDWNWLKSPAAESFNGGGLRGLTHDPFLKFKINQSIYLKNGKSNLIVDPKRNLEIL